MFRSIWQEIENEFRNGTMVSKLLIVNCSVFVAFILVHLCDYLIHPDMYGWSRDAAHYFMIPSNIKSLLLRIWTPITSMFLHLDFWHILFNMIFLMMFGNIVGDLIGDKRVLPIYLLGGLAGNLAFLVYANLSEWHTDVEHFALGASGAVMALGGVAASVAPDYAIRLLLFGEVKLKYIVLVMLLLDMVGIADDMNTGGHFAHLGGFFYGLFYVRQIRVGDDPADKVNAFLERIKDFLEGRNRKPLRGKKQPVVSYRNPQKATANQAGPKSDQHDLSHQEIVDSILDKIKAKGYDSLTNEEKKYLFDASNRD